MNQDRAETVALAALGWLVGNEELLPVFMGATGGAEADLKTRAAAPEFLCGVLDFVTMDDTWVIEMCDASGLDYSEPLTARAVLSGGEVHWT